MAKKKNRRKITIVDSGNHKKYAVFIETSDKKANIFMKRSFFSVLKSYFFRVDKGIKTRNIYEYTGNSEAYRLLNRNFIETITESIHAKKLQ